MGGSGVPSGPAVKTPVLEGGADKKPAAAANGAQQLAKKRESFEPCSSRKGGKLVRQTGSLSLSKAGRRASKNVPL